jgi:hypothetical protein
MIPQWFPFVIGFVSGYIAFAMCSRLMWGTRPIACATLIIGATLLGFLITEIV